MANRDPVYVPHGVYPCQGEDRWCAIAVQTEEQWRSLCAVLGDPDWSGGPEFATAEERRANQDRLDELIGQWTARLAAEEVMQSLQQAGVPASVVSQGQDLHNSPHLAERGFYQPSLYYVAQRGTPAYEWEEGQSMAWSSPVRMSKTPMEFGHYSNIGEDNDYVFQEVLGMPETEVRRLEENGALY
mgnify:FL=1